MVELLACRIDSLASSIPILQADGDVPGASEGNLVPAEGAQDTEKVVQQVRTGMDERLASLKLLNHILPPLTIAAKGQQVLSFTFQFPFLSQLTAWIQCVWIPPGSVGFREGLFSIRSLGVSFLAV